MSRKERTLSSIKLYDDDFDGDAISPSSQPPEQRNAANARERMRMRVLSSAYGRLKTKLPNIPPDTKLSKLDTLRLATLYIKQLITTVESGSCPNASDDMLDTSHMSELRTVGGGGRDGANSIGIGAFNIQNNGNGSMSWPFEFHQHFQHGNRNLLIQSPRMDWQAAPPTFPKASCSATSNMSEFSYTQIQDTHETWYPSESLSMEQAHGSNGCDYAGLGQHQRGIINGQAHGL